MTKYIKFSLSSHIYNTQMTLNIDENEKKFGFFVKTPGLNVFYAIGQMVNYAQNRHEKQDY